MLGGQHRERLLEDEEEDAQDKDDRADAAKIDDDF